MISFPLHSDEALAPELISLFLRESFPIFNIEATLKSILFDFLHHQMVFRESIAFFRVRSETPQEPV